MATPLVTQHYPDDFQVVTYSLHNYATLAASTGWLYADRDLIVDAVYVGISTVAGQAGTVKVTKSTTGSASSPVAPLNGTQVDITTTVALNATGTTVLTPISTSGANEVKAGNWISLTVGGTTLTSGLVGSIVLRFRSRYA